MASLYAGLETLKRAVGIAGATKDATLLRLLEAASRRIDSETKSHFIPVTQTRYYRWPNDLMGLPGVGYRLWLDGYLLSVSLLQVQAQDASPTTITAADYFLEPSNFGPPYDRIEVDLSSASYFQASSQTPQRSISVAGTWGSCQDTKAAGALAEALDISETGVDITNASLIDVGDTILIESEAMYVSGRSALDTTANLNGNLTADKSGTAVTVTDGTKVNAGEVILVGVEKMYVDSIATNVLTVIRAYDGTALAAHTGAVDIYAYRTLTVVRASNGTTAATHANATAINKYVPPFDITELCIAETVAAYEQEQAGWGRTIGVGEGAVEFRGGNLGDLRKRVIGFYRRLREGVV